MNEISKETKLQDMPTM